MSNPNIAEVGKATQFKVGNPGGSKPKGSKHISTWIQKITTDDEFTVKNFMASGETFKGAPLEAIIAVAVSNAMQGDHHWAEWIAKHGWPQQAQGGNTLNVIFTNSLPRPATDSVGPGLQSESEAVEVLE